MKSYNLVLVLFVVIANVLGGLNSQLCEITTQSEGKDLPILPDQFQSHVEHNFQGNDLYYTDEYDEYYDLINKRATVHKYIGGKTIEKIFFLYATNELISITDQVCLVIPLNTTVGDNPFGLLTVNSTLSMKSPSYILKFGFDFNYTKYEGIDSARGIIVEKWSSCIYIDILKLTVKGTWTWSNSNWTTLNPIFGSIPVEMTIEAQSENGIHSIEKYQYTSYRPFVIADPSVFETPNGVYCNGRIATKPLPKVQNFFSYRLEATLIEQNKTTAQSEWYDFDNKLARFDYQPLNEIDPLISGKDKVSEIHDYNAGIRYIIDRKTEKCLNITTLDPYADNDGIFDGNSTTNYTRIRTAIEMFHFDKVNYQYHGSRKVRGIDCDIWIAKRDDWPPQPGSNTTSIWEWAFSSDKWIAINSGEPSYNIPIQLNIQKITYVTDKFSYTTKIVYNYFDFKNERPDIFEFGLETCFVNSDVKHMMLTFKNINHDLIEDLHEFRYQFLNTISKLTYILPTRIDQVQLDFKGSNAYVEFKLLEKPNILGNVNNPISQLQLKDVVVLLRQKVNDGDFMFTVNNKTFVASTNSLKEVISDDQQIPNPFTFTVIIVIIITGIACILVGVVTFFIFTKIKNRSSNDLPSLSMNGLMTR